MGKELPTLHFADGVSKENRKKHAKQASGRGQKDKGLVFE